MRQLRPAEGDAVEDVEPALEHQLGVAPVGLAGAGDGESEDRDQRLRVAHPAGREAKQVTVERVIDVPSVDGQVDRQ